MALIGQCGGLTAALDAHRKGENEANMKLWRVEKDLVGKNAQNAYLTATKIRLENEIKSLQSSVQTYQAEWALFSCLHESCS